VRKNWRSLLHLLPLVYRNVGCLRGAVPHEAKGMNPHRQLFRVMARSVCRFSVEIDERTKAVRLSADDG
jgi:hypothetical protein